MSSKTSDEEPCYVRTAQFNSTCYTYRADLMFLYALQPGEPWKKWVPRNFDIAGFGVISMSFFCLNVKPVLQVGDDGA